MSGVGWTEEEYGRCPELAARLHSRILTLEDELRIAEWDAAVARGELDTALASQRQQLGPTPGLTTDQLRSIVGVDNDWDALAGCYMAALRVLRAELERREAA